MPEDTPVEIHVYGPRYKPGQVLVYERGELVYYTKPTPALAAARSAGRR